MMIAANLASLSLADLAAFRALAAIGAARLDDDFVAATFAELVRGADIEANRRLAQRPPFPALLHLPLDEDADPATVGIHLHALMAVLGTLRDGAATSRPALAGVWGELLAGVAELRSSRSRDAGSVAELLTRTSRV